MIKIQCDRCGAQTTDGKYWAKINAKEYPKGGEKEVHLCDSCYWQFSKRFVNNLTVERAMKEAKGWR